MNSPIDDYVAQVKALLTLKGAALREALADLTAALDERAAATSPQEAATAFGPAADYAANLDAEFAAPSRWATILGMPNAFLPGFSQRIVGTFDPADPRVLVPRVFGAGWAVNSGAVAVRLGLLNPDDLDDELAAEAVSGPGRLARGLAAVPGVLGLVRAGRNAVRGGRPVTETAIDAAMSLVGIGLAVASASEGLPARERLALPGIAAFMGSVALADGLASPSKRRGGGSLSQVAGLVAGTALSFALQVLPVRAAVQARTVKNA